MMKSAVNIYTIQRITLSVSVTAVAGRSLSGISWAGLPSSTARNSGRQETGSGRSIAMINEDLNKSKQDSVLTTLMKQLV